MYLLELEMTESIRIFKLKYYNGLHVGLISEEISILLKEKMTVTMTIYLNLGLMLLKL